MKVKLMGYTQTVPETFIGIDNLQDFVAYCARVSNPANQMSSATAEKLIKYLKNNQGKHYQEFVNELLSFYSSDVKTCNCADEECEHRVNLLTYLNTPD